MRAERGSDDADAVGRARGGRVPEGDLGRGFAHQLLPETGHRSPSAAVHLDRLPDTHMDYAANTPIQMQMPVQSLSVGLCSTVVFRQVLSNRLRQFECQPFSYVGLQFSIYAPGTELTQLLAMGQLLYMCYLYGFGRRLFFPLASNEAGHEVRRPLPGCPAARLPGCTTISLFHF